MKTICNGSYIRPQMTSSQQAARASIWQSSLPTHSVGRRSSSWLHWLASIAWSRLRSTRSMWSFLKVSRRSGVARFRECWTGAVILITGAFDTAEIDSEVQDDDAANYK